MLRSPTLGAQPLPARMGRRIQVTKPVILTVDDDPAVLGAIERDLRRHYRADYRVLKAASGAAGLEAARDLAARNTPIALFLVDQRMPGMTGTELLRAVSTLHPSSRRVLLTAYADTDVAIAGINELGLDHYLLKPWDPPEERLYPVLDDLLGEWRARVRPAFEGIRVLGSEWSPQSYQAKEFLSRNQVPYEWVDIERDAPARALAESLAGDLTRLPVVTFPDGSHLIAPSHSDLASKAGMQTHASRPFYDVIVIGGGPAGPRQCGVRAPRRGLRTVLVESEAPGGQAGTSSLHRELSRLSRRGDGRRPRAPCDGAGAALRGRVAHRAGGRGAAPRRSVSRRGARGRHRADRVHGGDHHRDECADARRARHRAAAGRRRLLRRRHDRSGALPRQGCVRRGRRQLRGPGRAVLFALRAHGHDAGARAGPAAHDVAVPGGPHPRHEEYRGPERGRGRERAGQHVARGHRGEDGRHGRPVPAIRCRRCSCSSG